MQSCTQIGVQGNGGSGLVTARSHDGVTVSRSVAAMARAELASESIGMKIAIHDVRGEAEREAARDKAIRTTLSRQMKSASNGCASADANALSRVSRRVTAANPLLDDSD